MGQPLDAQIRQLEELYRSDADPDGRGFVPLADAYRKAGELEKALELVEEGLREHPSYLAAHVVGGWIHRQRGDRDAAGEAFRQVLEIDPRNVEGLRSLSELLLEDERGEEALEFLERLGWEDPTDPELPARVRELKEEVAPAPAEEAVEQPEAEVEEQPEAEAEEFSAEMPVVEEPSAEDVAEAPALVESQDPAVDTEVEKAFEEALILPEEPAEELPEPEEAAEEFEEAAEDPAAELPEPEGPAAEEESEPEEDDGLWVAEDGHPIPGPTTQEPALPTRTLGEVYLRQGLFERAEEVFRQLLQTDPGNPELEGLLEKARDRHGAAPSRVRAPRETPPSGIVPIATLAPGPALEVVPIESLAPEPALEAVPVELLAPDPAPEAFPIESLAPDPAPEAVPIESLAPDPAPEAVPVESLAPDPALEAVPAELLAPDPAPEAVPIESLAPDPAPEAVPIESLAPDPAPEVEEDPTMDDFQNWLDNLQ